MQVADDEGFIRERVLSLLSERLRQSHPHREAPPDAPAPDAAELRTRLNELLELLAAGQMAARDATEEIATSVRHTPHGTHFAEVVAAVRELDFELAQAKLAQLINQIDAPG